eukprot:scaffold283318_cov21-Prasinocladus_malaysianus.AAC.1
MATHPTDFVTASMMALAASLGVVARFTSMSLSTLDTVESAFRCLACFGGLVMAGLHRSGVEA